MTGTGITAMRKKKKAATGKTYMSGEELLAEFDRADREWEAMPLYRRLPTYARRAKNKVLPPGWHMRPKWFIQRGRRGWADIDTASLDWYVTALLADALLYMADHTHSWPDDLYPTFEDWQAHLRDLAGRIAAWNQAAGRDDSEAGYDVTRAALAEFAEQLGAYWD
jgi:hypothetical protein